MKKVCIKVCDAVSHCPERKLYGFEWQCTFTNKCSYQMDKVVPFINNEEETERMLQLYGRGHSKECALRNVVDQGKNCCCGKAKDSKILNWKRDFTWKQWENLWKVCPDDCPMRYLLKESQEACWLEQEVLVEEDGYYLRTKKCLEEGK